MTISIDEELISYLQRYGNIKESDLIEYGKRFFQPIGREVKCMLNIMVLEGKAKFVVPDKLGPEVVYLA